MQSERAIKAKEYFNKGYSCSQAVVLAFEDKFPIDSATLLKIASSFGGGMGRLREVCGAVSGMFIVMGMISGYDTPSSGDKKRVHYKNIQALAKEFEAVNGNIVCRELLGLNVNHDSPIPEERTKEYYKKRPCANLVESAVTILENYISNL